MDREDVLWVLWTSLIVGLIVGVVVFVVVFATLTVMTNA